MEKALYQSLAENIYKMYPKLKRLSFGCEVNLSEDFIQSKRRSGIFYRNPCKILHKYDATDSVVSNGQQDTNLVRKHNYSIIGHSITLEHVLRACNDTLRKEKSNKTVVYDSRALLLISRGEIIATLETEYNKPLSEQSDQLGVFLSDILL